MSIITYKTLSRSAINPTAR